MDKLFAYGTLMCDDMFHSVTGEHLPSVRGFLRQYSRHPVIGQVYPGILPKRNGAVEGIVYLDLPDRIWRHLDRFEGEMYERRMVRVECCRNSTVTAWTYVVRPQFIHCLDQERPWDSHDFLAAGKRTFRENYPGLNTGLETQ